MIVTIIGLGLIGGSLAIDLKKRKFATRVIGVDSNELHANVALNLKIVDDILPLNDAIDRADVVVLAVPVDATLKLLPKVLDRVENQVVTDVCSTKATLTERIKYHQKRANYVAAHPMAGTENSGPWAAMSGLFDGKAVILCDCEDSHEKSVHAIRQMFDAVNMRPIYMNAVNHDVHVAYVSHISHISSFALALTVLEKEKNEKNIFDLASGGFDSTVRLAKSSADMWVPIFSQNANNITTVLDTYIDKLINFRDSIKNAESEKLSNYIFTANKIKKILNK